MLSYYGGGVIDEIEDVKYVGPDIMPQFLCKAL